MITTLTTVSSKTLPNQTSVPKPASQSPKTSNLMTMATLTGRYAIAHMVPIKQILTFLNSFLESVVSLSQSSRRCTWLVHSLYWEIVTSRILMHIYRSTSASTTRKTERCFLEKRYAVDFPAVSAMPANLSRAFLFLWNNSRLSLRFFLKSKQLSSLRVKSSLVQTTPQRVLRLPLSRNKRNSRLRPPTLNQRRRPTLHPTSSTSSNTARRTMRPRVMKRIETLSEQQLTSPRTISERVDSSLDAKTRPWYTQRDDGP